MLFIDAPLTPARAFPCSEMACTP